MTLHSKVFSLRHYMKMLMILKLWHMQAMYIFETDGDFLITDGGIA